jgi:hypothetical protein
MPEQETPTPESVETGVTEVTTTETPAEPTGEVDIDKTDNLSQLRTYARSLKDDLGKYKPSHEFLETQFGGKSNAELAAKFYGGFAGEEFDADKFLETVNQLSPSRAKVLTDKLSSAQASQLAEAEITKLFGSKPNPEEISLFKKFKESGYGLGEGDDIPEALKFDAQGNPKSDEEIQFLRDLHKRVNEDRTAKAQEAAEAKLKEESDLQTKIQESINNFSTERLKVLDNEFKSIGLQADPKDTAEEAQEKEFVKSFIRNGIAGAFMEDPTAATDYQKAVGHIQTGEPLFASRYEPKIEAKLLEIFRSKAVGRMLESLAKEPTPRDELPEINESGASTTGGDIPKNRETADEIYARLVGAGKIRTT